MQKPNLGKADIPSLPNWRLSLEGVTTTRQRPPREIASGSLDHLHGGLAVTR